MSKRYQAASSEHLQSAEGPPVSGRRAPGESTLWPYGEHGTVHGLKVRST
jgi:hypothetical protein